MKFDQVLEEISMYNTHPYLPTKKETIYDKNRKIGHRDDKFIFSGKNNKFASKRYGKFDSRQYNLPPNTDDTKDYFNAIKKNKSYLVKVNNGYRVKI